MNLHFSSPKDIDDFVETLGKFERGEIGADEFRAYRLARGTYGQRQMDASMLRVKIPQGILNAEQTEALADVAEKYSRGFGHVTTRQNIQFHFMKLDQAADAMRLLDQVGITTKEACGNTVRNVTACALAGVCKNAPFDVTPYGQAITRHFLRNPICQSLPRKFKIAVSGCSHDCAQGAINDIGLVAQMKEGARGFRLRVGGGLSTSPENGHILEEFVFEKELLAKLEAVVRVFDRTGNRENKARARIKYVIRKIGIEGFRAEYEKDLADICAAGRGQNAVDISGAIRPDTVLRRGPAPELHEGEIPAGYDVFFRTNCIAQLQPGYYAVLVRLVRGDIMAVQLRAVARLARQYNDGSVRTTNEQNLLLQFIPEKSLTALYRDLLAIDLGLSGARTIEDVTACPGADTCNLAVTKSRELATSISAKLAATPGRFSAVEKLDVKISGCPNSCGQHHIAALGFHGTMRRVGDKTVPEYQLHLGGGIDASGATFGRQVVKVPARRVADAVVRLVELFERDKTAQEQPLDFFRRVDPKVVKGFLADLSAFDEKTAIPEDYLDNGDEKPFVVAIGQGECAA